MSEALEQLVRVGMPGGPSPEESLRIFARLRATPEEGRAIQRLLAREATAPLPEPLLVAVATALVERGEAQAAVQTLARSRSMPALVLRADLLHDAGDTAAALALVEQVLARDLDWPGARERHARWRQAIGAPAMPRSDPPAMASVAPELPFRLLREAARGGSATVYEAQDPDLERRLAVKVYHRPDRDRAKLLHEARVAVAVAGDGVVPVFDVDPRAGWLAMQWAPLGALGPGAAVRAKVQTGAWALPLARALARVHAAGWVHNDVKPANVLLRAPEAPMLGDFGIARRRGDPSPPGSLGYVSPERLAGRSSDPRDDVYGFGRLLAESLEVPDLAWWEDLAAACTGPDEGRPRDGAELAAIVEKLSGAQK